MKDFNFIRISSLLFCPKSEKKKRIYTFLVIFTLFDETVRPYCLPFQCAVDHKVSASVFFPLCSVGETDKNVASERQTISQFEKLKAFRGKEG